MLAFLLALASAAAVATHPTAVAGSQAAPAASLEPLKGLTVGIDPGHNGGNFSHPTEINRLVPAGGFHKACDTTGTASRGGYREATYTLDVAKRLRKIVEGAGGTVIMTRTNNRRWGPCVNKRARITNGADVAVSIHADGSLGRGNRGFHVIEPKLKRGYTNDIFAQSKRLGTLTRNALRDNTSLPTSNYIGSRGISVRGDLGGLNLSNVPKVMVESGNMKNSADMRVLGRERGRQKIARAIALAIAAWAERR
jgi:N-acetylmuramoyl-L-alanine amidase